MNPKKFFGELKRRHVYKMGAAYVVGGWLLVQVVTQVFPVFQVSALAQRIIVLVIVAGFPITLVLAWLFDITSQGIVRTGELPASGEAPAVRRERRGTDRKLNYILGALLLVAIAYFATERFGLIGSRKIAGATTGTNAKSIAVLPFENLSRDPDNAFFATGIQDEILTRISRIGALKVISRVSTQQYAPRPSNLPEIAHQLGVANFLEGSVQRAADQVHINVQLVRAATYEHLWANSYDRKLENIFGVEAEVATAVAEALNAKLTGAEQHALEQTPTNNPKAYDAYLRGIALWGDPSLCAFFACESFMGLMVPPVWLSAAPASIHSQIVWRVRGPVQRVSAFSRRIFARRIRLGILPNSGLLWGSTPCPSSANKRITFWP